jgi:hypothetical protein
MGTLVLHTAKRQNLNASSLDFERDASINDVPFEGWNLGFMSVTLNIQWIWRAYIASARCKFLGH